MKVLIVTFLLSYLQLFQMNRIPALFIGHGAPNTMLQIESDLYKFWVEWGEQIVSNYQPKGIVIVSAHWIANGFTIGNPKSTKLIYDFSGFEQELYQINYPVQPDQELIEKIENILSNTDFPTGKILDRSYDHGVWSPLAVMFPKADIPVVQISLDRNLDTEMHIKLGKMLKPLRDQGYLIIGSGQITHNLRGLFQENPGYKKFESWLTDVQNLEYKERIEKIKNWRSQEGASEKKATKVFDGWMAKTLSLACWQFD